MGLLGGCPGGLARATQDIWGKIVQGDPQCSLNGPFSAARLWLHPGTG